MSNNDYAEASKVCDLVLNQKISSIAEVKKRWPNIKDEFLDEIFNVIIEFFGEIKRNKGVIERNGAFYLLLYSANQILNKSFCSNCSIKLYEEVNDQDYNSKNLDQILNDLIEKGSYC